MDGWLKILIASACAVIIAGGAFYAWSEWSAHRERQARAERRDGAVKELFELAKAGPNEVDKVREFCKQLKERLDGDLKDNDLAFGVSTNCRILGYSY